MAPTLEAIRPLAPAPSAHVFPPLHPPLVPLLSPPPPPPSPPSPPPPATRPYCAGARVGPWAAGAAANRCRTAETLPPSKALVRTRVNGSRRVGHPRAQTSPHRRPPIRGRGDRHVRLMPRDEPQYLQLARGQPREIGARTSVTRREFVRWSLSALDLEGKTVSITDEPPSTPMTWPVSQPAPATHRSVTASPTAAGTPRQSKVVAGGSHRWPMGGVVEPCGHPSAALPYELLGDEGALSIGRCSWDGRLA